MSNSVYNKQHCPVVLYIGSETIQLVIYSCVFILFNDGAYLTKLPNYKALNVSLFKFYCEIKLESITGTNQYWAMRVFFSLNDTTGAFEGVSNSHQTGIHWLRLARANHCVTYHPSYSNLRIYF